MAQTGPKPHDRFRVVIAGGGVAALEAMLTLRELAGDRVAIELVAPEPHFWYRPLAVAEPFGLGRVHRFELGRLAAAAGASFCLDGVARVDVGARMAHTRAGQELRYDALLLAVGARTENAVPGTTVFRGPADAEVLARLLHDAEEKRIESVAFVAPPGASWALPLYELALLTRSHLDARGVGCRVDVVTPEPSPLALFGARASGAIGALLVERGIRVRSEAHALRFSERRVELLGGDPVEAEAAVSLPRLKGPSISGLPVDGRGFIPTDTYGGVRGADGVFAAGDATTFPVKQGGLAAQQAEAAAEAIAVRAGVALRPTPFGAVLRGLLLTGGVPQFIRTDLAGWGQHAFALDTDPLWWPPAKVAARHLSPFLAELGGYTAASGPPPHGVPVDVDLSARIESAA